MKYSLAEQVHFVNALPPLDIDAAGGRASDVWSMANYDHATIVIQLGVTGAASTITVEACDDFVPTNTTAIPFAVYKCETAASDLLGARTAVTSAGFATSTNDGIMYVIEVNAEDLPSGKPYLRVSTSDPAAATFGSILAILSKGRYTGTQSATVIA